MPLFYQHNINGSTQIGVWHITEAESFFLEKVPLEKSIANLHKRLQHLAGRYLLQYMVPSFPYHLLEIADTRKPFLSNEEYHFSISHCGDYAAVIISKDNRVGVDVEMTAPKIEQIQHKFITAKEQSLISDAMLRYDLSKEKLLIVCWSIKEAMYKWIGGGGVDFKDHLAIEGFTFMQEGGTVLCSVNMETSIKLTASVTFFNNICLATISSTSLIP